MANEYKHIEMVGRLATDEEISQEQDTFRYKTAIFINKQGEIQYKVKSLSIKNDVTESQFTGYISSINNLDFVDDFYALPDERIERFREFYRSSLFVFSYKIDAMGNHKIDSADIVSAPTKKGDEDARYIAVPCFSPKSEVEMVDNFPLYRKYDSFEEFLSKLCNNYPVGRIYNYKLGSRDNLPDFVIWKDSVNLYAIGPITSASYAMDELILQIDPNNYYIYPLEEDEDAIDSIIQSDENESLFHLPEKSYIAILNNILKSAEIPAPDLPDETPPSLPLEETVSTPVEAVPEKRRDLPNEKTENAILEFFRYHSQKNKLFYSPKDIANFHTAVKTGSLVILSGMSGTGKSAIVDTYAKALGISENVLMIPVRPSWNDDSDLLGYVDLVHMVYRPSDTGFINKIVEASLKQNQNNLYIICLDEMNLARVEHYFSQFLSILEKPVGARELVLYDEQYAGQLYNSSKYPQKVSIGENIKFIGTVNIDESTYHFSDKVLDRANVISLEVLDYSHPDNWREDKYNAPQRLEWHNDDFNKIIKRESPLPLDQARLREFLWKMHNLIHAANANLGVGPRIVKSIENYLRNLPETEESSEYTLSAEEGLDYQVLQRVLTKIRGPEGQLKDLFECDSDGEIPLLSLMDDFRDISTFDRCRRVIIQKEKELKVYGYCL